MKSESRLWQTYGAGSTLGQRGSEDGVIVLDEEHPDGARITLEDVDGRYAVTCGVYGLMVHTRLLADRSHAMTAIAPMKDGLVRILNALPDATDEPPEFGAAITAAQVFVSEFP